MKRLCIWLVVLFCSVPLHAQKTRFGQELPFAKPGVDYPVAVHVYGLHVRNDCGNDRSFCINVLFADITARGKKLELRITSDLPEKPYKESGGTLVLGDFRARLLDKKTSGVDLGDKYEIVLANNQVLQCVVSGMVE